MSVRTRSTSLLTLALIAPLLVWLAPPASAAVGDVSLAAPNGRDVWPGQKPSALGVDNPAPSSDAIVTFRNRRGTLVRTMSAPPTCFFDHMHPGPVLRRPQVSGTAGTTRAVRRLRALHRHCPLIDQNGQPHNTSLGNLWVNRLVTRTRAASVETGVYHPLDALSTIGRCSPVARTAARRRPLARPPALDEQVQQLGRNRRLGVPGTAAELLRGRPRLAHHLGTDRRHRLAGPRGRRGQRRGRLERGHGAQPDLEAGGRARQGRHTWGRCSPRRPAR